MSGVLERHDAHFKNGQRSQQTCLQRRHRNGQCTQECSTLISQEGNANRKRDATSHPRGWLESKRQTIARVREHVERLESSPTAGGNAKCSRFGKQSGSPSPSSWEAGAWTGAISGMLYGWDFGISGKKEKMGQSGPIHGSCGDGGGMKRSVCCPWPIGAALMAAPSPACTSFCGPLTPFQEMSFLLKSDSERRLCLHRL